MGSSASLANRGGASGLREISRVIMVIISFCKAEFLKIVQSQQFKSRDLFLLPFGDIASKMYLFIS